jgi:hypothetical protein
MATKQLTRKRGKFGADGTDLNSDEDLRQDAGVAAPPAPPLAPTKRAETPRFAEVSEVEIPQYRRRTIFAIWAAAALPMGVLAWLVAPALADSFAGAGNVPMAKALFLTLGAGLVWQFVLVVALVGREQRTLRWSVLRDALWLRSPRSRGAAGSAAGSGSS